MIYFHTKCQGKFNRKNNIFFRWKEENINQSHAHEARGKWCTDRELNWLRSERRKCFVYNWDICICILSWMAASMWNPWNRVRSLRWTIYVAELCGAVVAVAVAMSVSLKLTNAMWWLAVWCNTDYPFHLITIIIVCSRGSQYSSHDRTRPSDKVIQVKRLIWCKWDLTRLRDRDVTGSLYFPACSLATHILSSSWIPFDKRLCFSRISSSISHIPILTEQTMYTNFFSYTGNLHAVKPKNFYFR